MIIRIAKLKNTYNSVKLSAASGNNTVNGCNVSEPDGTMNTIVKVMISKLNPDIMGRITGDKK